MDSEEIKQGNVEQLDNASKTCFIIMPISDVDGYSKGHFNRIYEHLIKPACIKCGLVPVRADDTAKTNVIIIDILQKILESDIAICDLSASNPNVFYELGFRQAFNKKTVLIKDKRTTTPFDIASLRYSIYDESLRIDLVEDAVASIAKMLHETLRSDEKDVNSLFQLLNVHSPASLPEKVNVSNDTSLILQAIENLKGLTHKSSIEEHKNCESIRLKSGDVVNIGERIYNRSGQFLGKLVKISVNGDLTLQDESGNRILISVDSPLQDLIYTLPF